MSNSDDKKLAAVRKQRDGYRRTAKELKEKLAAHGQGEGSLPWAEDAEAAVLSLCLQFPSRAVSVLRDRFSRDGEMGLSFFYTPKNKILWRSMLELWMKDGTFDLVILVEQLRESGKLENVGGAAGVAEHLDHVPGMSFLDHYMGAVEDAWRRRKLWLVALHMKEEALDGDVGRSLVRAANEIESLRTKVLSESEEVEVQEVIDYLSTVPDKEPVFLCEHSESAEAMRSALGVFAINIYDVELSPELKKSLTGSWVVCMIETDPNRVKSWLRTVFELVYRAAYVDLSVEMACAYTEFSLKDYCLQMKGDERLKKKAILSFRKLAHGCQVPKDIAFDLLYTFGVNGGVQVLQKKLASRLVKYHDLHFSGNFWKWDAGGVWKSIHTDETIHEWITEGLMHDTNTHGSISSSLVDSVYNLMRSESHCHPDALNQTKKEFLINCKNGMLDVISGELKPHQRKNLSTTQASVEWDEEAECPNWLEWLKTMKPNQDEVDQIQEMFGYCLVPSINYHVFFFLYGQGGTGKSTCVDVLSALVGEENCLALQLEELGNPFTRSRLVGKQIYLCGELTKYSFKHIGLIKQIAAGEPIYVDVKHRPGFSFRPGGRFVMTSNVHAATPDTSTGFERRFMQITWKNAIKREDQDFDLPNKLRSELPGILRWAVEGFRRLYERGHFAHTEENVEAIKELMRHRDQIRSFRNDSQGVWVDWNSPASNGNPDGMWCENEDLFKKWEEWCDWWGVKPFTESQMIFYRELNKADPDFKAKMKRSIHPSQPNGGRIRWIKGVELLSGEKDD